MAFKTGITQVLVITKQLFGTTPTFCLKCGKQKSFKIIREDASYTRLCDCGCQIVQFHKPDEFHKTIFFTEKFITKNIYRPDFKNKSELEKMGFEKKIEKNGKTILEK